MPQCCIVCSVVASPDLQLHYCDQCHSAVYCSRACQRIDWKKEHKKICKLLNVGHGGMQFRTAEHTSRQSYNEETFELNGHEADGLEDGKQFFKLFEESTFEGSRAAALEMRKIAERQTKQIHTFLIFHSLHFLLLSDKKKLSWPNSPLLVLLQVVDPVDLKVPDGALQQGELHDLAGETPLHDLARQSNTSDNSAHENLLILAKQLIAHGVNVNAVAIKQGDTPLHMACDSAIVTNLDFIELLLEEGADPNAQDHQGCTPLGNTIRFAPGAAKCLLNWPTTDVKITDRYGGKSFLARVREAEFIITNEFARPDSPTKVQHQFLLQQWRGIEDMLVERGP
jgi:hypothetical protein